MDLAGQIVIGLIVAMIFESMQKAKGPTAAQIAAANNARAGIGQLPVRESDALMYDLNFYPNAADEIAATSGIDTGASVTPPNATPTFVPPDEGAI